jgi:hypothetical protein
MVSTHNLLLQENTMDIYKIVSVLDGQVMAVSHASHDQAAQLIQYPYGGDPSQQWELVPVGQNRYQIRSVNSGQVVAISHASQDQTAELIQFPYDGDTSQQWQIVPIEGDFFKLVSVLSGQVVAVSGASKDKATPLIQFPYDGDNSQQWQRVWIDEQQSICKFVSLINGQVMTVANDSHTPGDPLIQSPYNGDSGQKWQLTPLGDNRYTLVSVLNNQAVSVSGHSHDNGAALVQEQFVDNDSSQQWKFVPLRLSKIVSAETGQVVAVAGASKEKATQLIQFPYTGDSSQQWKLDKVAADPLTKAEIEALISRYGPILRFHPDEKYLMCSIEWFLQHAHLHDSTNRNVIDHPSVAQLPTGPKEGRRYWLTLDDNAKGGSLPTAKAYVHAYAPEGQGHTDLQFFFFYAYNGPGTLHLFTTISSGDAGVQPLGEHYGDWETCVLRVDNVTKKLIGVWLSQHESGQWFDASKLDRFQRKGEQIIIYSSRNGHAVYSGTGPNPTYEGDYLAVSWYLRNDTADGGESLDCSTRYQLVSGPSVNEPRWIDYPYRWGPEDTHTEITQEQATEIVEVALGTLSFLVPTGLAGRVVAAIISVFRTEDLNGPEGPKQKDSWRGIYK